ncbi:histidinol-phosphate transaminase [Malassezia yamatoensis]|uniref:histidinol-phosphate transaminase n=1 Tax=Malassezia yamatoensis TaxID=253288 RepID=A0AAJ5YU40_9BASI|nr:histidinol-phosphate transaminase [Malassezia yamatoensis]
MPILGVSERANALCKAHKPSQFRLEDVVRPNILELQPYYTERDEYEATLLLDANENSYGPMITEKSQVTDAMQMHRYPSPDLMGTREGATKLRNMPDSAFTFLGVGSDEVIDLMLRCFARPGKDKILICPPTYSMYKISAMINEVEVVSVPLILDGKSFAIDVPKVLETMQNDPLIKMVILCSPGNPTGSLLDRESIFAVLNCPNYRGLVVVDEAYIDFPLEEQAMKLRYVDQPVSAVDLVPEYANLIVSQTLSKSFGLAGVRLGLAYAQPATVQIMNNTKAPYSISAPAAYYAAQALSPEGIKKMHACVRTMIQNRTEMIQALQSIPNIGRVLGNNDANFILVEILKDGRPDNERACYIHRVLAQEHGLMVRNRCHELGCEGCLRISVGTPEENQRCTEATRQLLQT